MKYSLAKKKGATGLGRRSALALTAAALVSSACIPTDPVPDYECSYTTSGNTATISFGGDRAYSENLRIDGDWVATVTGQNSHSATIGANPVVTVRLRGNGYDGPDGYFNATCQGAGSQGDPYAENLALIKGQSIRNTNHDNSPQRNTPQSQLDISTGGGLVGTDRSAYLGNPNSNPEQSFPVSNGGQFRIGCEFSHFGYDDPLVHPNQPGRAHLHMFFGNTDVNAYSTFESLRDSGSSTCNGGEANRTGYWVPAMIDGDGQARIPERIVAYYKGEGLANGAGGPSATGSLPYKPGMANIATANGLGIPEVPTVDGGQAGEVHYKCSNNWSAWQFADGIDQIPDCSGDHYGNYPHTRTVLEMEIKFWNCFPANADPTDWSQWAPAGKTRGSWFFSNCTGEGGQSTGAPAKFDKEIYPNLVYYVNYVVEPGDDTSDWFLSSDVDHMTIQQPVPSLKGTPGASHHADWWGAWHPSINQEWLDNCVNFRVSGEASGCGLGYLTNGGPDGNNPLPGRTLEYRPQYDAVGDSNSYSVSLETLFDELCVPHGPMHTYNQGDSPRKAAACLHS